MSPEQAKGRVADRRSDVWAFGCVLFEMLTGRRAFEGDEVSETVAAVLKGEPAWNALPDSVPPSIRTLLEGCLEKDYRQRVSDISTASFVLKRALDPRTSVASAPVTSRRRFLSAALLVLAGAAAAAAAFSILRPKTQAVPARVARFGIAITGDSQLTMSRRAIAFSPDGTRVVFSSGGKLYSRLLSDLEARPISGGDPGISPEFSPDGTAIVFWAEGQLKRVPVAGGAPVTICSTAPAPYGLQWTDSGIIFAQPAIGILRVSPNSGTPEVIVKITAAEGLAQGARLMPDGTSVIYALASATPTSLSFWDKATIVQQTIGSAERTTLVENGSEPRYLESGLLLYMLEGTMMAVRFDPAARKVTTGAVPILEGIRRSAASTGYAGQFDLSRTGSLVYVPGPSHSGQDDVYIYDRAGTSVRELNLPRGSYAYPRVSPDGARIAIESRSAQEAMVSIYELSGTTSLRRLTFGGNNRMPVWSPDGKRIAFQSDREGDLAIFWQPVNGGTAERLTRPEKGVVHVPESWSPNGDDLLFSATRQNESTLWTLSIRDGKATQFPDVKSAAFPTHAVFSPDGLWVAYQQGDGTMGEATTYVQPFPPNGTKYEIAHGGRPMWSRDGDEIFFVPAPSQFRSVSVRTEPVFSFTPPVPVLRRFGLAPPGTPRPYDILPDGRFVMVDVATAADEGPRGQVHVVLDWFSELTARIPAAR